MRLSILLLTFTAGLAAQTDALKLSVSLNQSSSAAISPSWPVIAQVLITNTEVETSLRLAPLQSAWPQAIHFSVTGPSGKPEDWKFELTAQPPEPAITLPARSRTSAFLVLDPEFTASLPEGNYTLKAELEISGSEGWNGLVRSPAVKIAVKSSPEPAAAEQLNLVLLRATVNLLRNQTAEARQILSDYLAVNGDAVPALRMMAELFEIEGDFVRGYVYAVLAVKAYSVAQPVPDSRTEPPGQLLALRNRVLRKALENLQ